MSSYDIGVDERIACSFEPVCGTKRNPFVNRRNDVNENPSNSSGISIERLAGEAFKPESIPAANSLASAYEPDQNLKMTDLACTRLYDRRTRAVVEPMRRAIAMSAGRCRLWSAKP